MGNPSITETVIKPALICQLVQSRLTFSHAMRSKVLAAIYEEPPVNPNECHLQDFLRLEEYGKK